VREVSLTAVKPIGPSPAGLAAAFGTRSSTAIEDRWIHIGKRRVLLRFGSPGMLRLMESFTHLSCESRHRADLTLHIWEGGTPPWPGADTEDGPRGLRMMLREGTLRVCYQPGQYTLSALEEAESQAWFWSQQSSQLPYWEHAAPFRLILSWWLTDLGANLVHGAAVGRPDGGALIVGRGGSGKSTTALLSLLDGLSYAADDYVITERDHEGRGPFVHSAFGSGKLDNEQCKRFPQLQSAIVNKVRGPEEKAVFLVNRFAPEQMASSFPLRAVLVPKITGRPDTRVRPGSSALALAALAPSTIFQLPGDPDTELKAMAEIVRAVPTHVLELGTDFRQIPRCIDQLLSELAVSAPSSG
jgi:hypothetical protein